MNADANNALFNLKTALAAELEQSEVQERRTICKRFYVTAEEDARLAELCQGVSLSAFARSKLFGSGIPRPRAIVPQINREAYIQLASLRSNCNQIAKAINQAAQQGQTLPLTPAYLDELRRLDELLVAIGLQLSQAQGTDPTTAADEP